MGQRSFVLDKLLADIKSKESAEWRGQRKGGYYRKNRKSKETEGNAKEKEFVSQSGIPLNASLGRGSSLAEVNQRDCHYLICSNGMNDNAFLMFIHPSDKYL